MWPVGNIHGIAREENPMLLHRTWEIIAIKEHLSFDFSVLDP